MSALILKGVSKAYGKVIAVKPLDLEIPKGKLVTLLGPSGCGKTTLLRLIAGLERASSGQIFMKDVDVTAQSAGDRNVSMVFQSYALFPHMNVLENTQYGLVSQGMAKDNAREKALESLASVGLKGFSERHPYELSGGQQQRVALARALVLQPEILLFDEPLSNLDARLRRSMREEIRGIQQALGLTAIYVTHDQSEAMAVSDEIIVMRNAEIAQKGTPRDLYEKPDNLFVAGFMGEANSVKGVLKNGTVTLDTLNLTFDTGDLSDGEIDIVIRPESLYFSENGLNATIKTACFMGQSYEYTLNTAIGNLFMISTEQRKVGEAMALQIKPNGILAVKP
jgi:iron(III) transport system ATP-binding protein